VALGNFDGMHRGHQTVFEETRALAHTLGREPVLVTFEPHPRTFFSPHTPLFRLTELPIKKALAELFSIAGIFVFPFTAELGSMGPDAFLTHLKEVLNPSGLVIGHDFHFAKGRAGTPAFLEEWAHEQGIPMRMVTPVRITPTGDCISSSAIRTCLSAGDVKAAADLLGYFWTVSGDVVHGEKRGRALGYPTINIPLPESCRLRYGAYVVRVRTRDTVYRGVASFGVRPTFEDSSEKPVLEVHLLSASVPDLYQAHVMVEFLDWIHAEKKCPSVEALMALIAQDCAYGHTFFKGKIPPHKSLVMAGKDEYCSEKDQPVSPS
jgi:riboflavin kinase/FMN adenylyltransferase